MAQPQPTSDAQPTRREDKFGTMERRQLFDHLIETGLKALPPLNPSLEEFWTTIPVHTRKGTICSSPTKVIRPKAATNPGKARPLVVYFYGGGFALGNPDMMVRPAREWAEEHNATVVLPTYRLTGEVLWPEFHEDGLQVVQEIAKGYAPEGHEPFFGANPKDGFIIGGASAGGVIAAVIAGLSSFSDDPAHKVAVPLTGLFSCIALYLRPKIVPEEYRDIWKSLAENAVSQSGQGLTAASIEEIEKSFRLKEGDLESPWFSPVNFWKGGKVPDGKAHPATYFQCGQFDPLRDDSVVYEKMLNKIGVKTKLDLFPKDGHATASVLPFPTISENPTVLEATINGLDWLLKQN